eukprot:5698605-Amphidinium_carterae.3
MSKCTELPDQVNLSNIGLSTCQHLLDCHHLAIFIVKSTCPWNGTVGYNLPALPMHHPVLPVLISPC